MSKTKTMASFRFSEQTLSSLDYLAKWTGKAKTEILEDAVKDMMRQVAIKNSDFKNLDDGYLLIEK